MDLNERIDRIKELIQQRDDINAKLEELLGNTVPKPLTVRDRQRVKIANQFPDKYTHRKQRTCKNCGQPGDRRDTCPNGTKVDPVEKKSEPLTEEQYDLVKARKEDGDTSSLDLSREPNVPIAEVNCALLSGTYEVHSGDWTKLVVGQGISRFRSW